MPRFCKCTCSPGLISRVAKPMNCPYRRTISPILMGLTANLCPEGIRFATCRDATCRDATCGDATCGDATCGDATCGDATCGDATCGDATCGDATCRVSTTTMVSGCKVVLAMAMLSSGCNKIATSSNCTLPPGAKGMKVRFVLDI